MKNSFRTEVSIHPSPRKINLKNKILTVGSCFSDSIGTKLVNHKFDCLVNPFGTTYNPYSISKLLESCVKNNIPEEDLYLRFSDDLLYHYDYHSSLFAGNKDALKSIMETKSKACRQYLSPKSWVVITLGTSIGYRHLLTNKVVNNCHKQASKNFQKVTLKPKRILDDLSKIIQQLPDCQIILTVSPVRHIKDTIAKNQYSKSILRFCCEELTEAHENVSYFPSYEIMIDDLRDYRFYSDDFIHPTPFAEDYIWEKFAACYFDEETLSFLPKWKSIKTALSHKAFHPESQEHQLFIKNTITKLENLSSYVDVNKELTTLKKQLRS